MSRRSRSAADDGSMTVQTLGRWVAVAACGTVALVVLAACFAPASPTPTMSADATVLAEAGADQGNCLGEVDYPGLPVWELNEELPLDGVTIEYVQRELRVSRGSGPCSNTSPIRVARAPRCTPLTGDSAEVVDVMLWHQADSLTEVSFAGGAVGALSETVTGHTSENGSFHYRMTAWAYPSHDEAASAPIFDLIRDCPGVRSEREEGIDRLTLFEGDEPHTVAVLRGDMALLLESIVNIGPDGAPATLRSTASGCCQRTPWISSSDGGRRTRHEPSLGRRATDTRPVAVVDGRDASVGLKDEHHHGTAASIRF